METLLKEVKALLEKYEERQRQKSVIISNGSIISSTNLGDMSKSLEDVNGAGRSVELPDSSGEIIDSLYKAVHSYIEKEEELNRQLELERGRRLEIERRYDYWRRKSFEYEQELKSGSKGGGKADRFEAGIEEIWKIVDSLRLLLDAQKSVNSNPITYGPGGSKFFI